MTTTNPNFLVYLDLQAQDPLWDYEPQRTWLEERGMRLAYTDRLTSYIVLIQTHDAQFSIEDAIRRTKYGYDSFLVVPISDFQSPDVVPDDVEILSEWVKRRPEWQAWRAAHNSHSQQPQICHHLVKQYFEHLTPHCMC